MSTNHNVAAMLGLIQIQQMGQSGAIERQEAEGQRQVVANSQLPRKIRGATIGQLTAHWGLTWTEARDPLFYNVQLAPGWSIEATGHSMWSDVLFNGQKRGSMFYKAAFYDLEAFLNVNQRYYKTTDYSDDQNRVVGIHDAETGTMCHVQGSYGVNAEGRTDFALSDKLESDARAWLERHFPDHTNPFAYWSAAK